MEENTKKRGKKIKKRERDRERDPLYPSIRSQPFLALFFHFFHFCHCHFFIVFPNDLPQKNDYLHLIFLSCLGLVLVLVLSCLVLFLSSLVARVNCYGCGCGCDILTLPPFITVCFDSTAALSRIARWPSFAEGEDEDGIWTWSWIWEWWWWEYWHYYYHYYYY